MPLATKQPVMSRSSGVPALGERTETPQPTTKGRPNMTNEKKKMKQLVAAIERGEGDEKKSYWTRIGVAFENRDVMRSDA
jgi:hypothetical protein